MKHRSPTLYKPHLCNDLGPWPCLVVQTRGKNARLLHYLLGLYPESCPGCRISEQMRFVQGQIGEGKVASEEEVARNRERGRKARNRNTGEKGRKEQERVGRWES